MITHKIIQDKTHDNKDLLNFIIITQFKKVSLPLASSRGLIVVIQGRLLLRIHEQPHGACAGLFEQVLEHVVKALDVLL